MARDGSGTYTRVVTPPVNGDVADADDYNAEQDDIADALTDSINAAGTKAFGANQSMGGFRLTDLATPSSANDAARKAYVDSAITAAAQPLDATLTALAALSWSSGSPVVQFTAADTVSLTLAPSVTSLTASGGVTANGANAFTAYRSGDAARFRAIEATNNNVWAWRNNANIASWDYNGTDSLLLEASAALYPASNDGLALGKASLSYSDLFLASGAVINFNNSNYTLTHSTGALEASGTFRARVPRSSEAGTPTSASANKKMLLTGGATIDSGTADDFYLMDPGTSARTITRGSGMTMYVNGADSATATLAANQMGAVHYRSSTVVVLTGAFS